MSWEERMREAMDRVTIARGSLDGLVWILPGDVAVEVRLELLSGRVLLRDETPNPYPHVAGEYVGCAFGIPAYVEADAPGRTVLLLPVRAATVEPVP